MVNKISLLPKPVGLCDLIEAYDHDFRFAVYAVGIKSPNEALRLAGDLHSDQYSYPWSAHLRNLSVWRSYAAANEARKSLEDEYKNPASIFMLTARRDDLHDLLEDDEEIPLYDENDNPLYEDSEFICCVDFQDYFHITEVKMVDKGDIGNWFFRRNKLK